MGLPRGLRLAGTVTALPAPQPIYSFCLPLPDRTAAVQAWVLHSWVLSTGPHAAVPLVTLRVCTWVPPPQGLEHALRVLHAVKVQPEVGHAVGALQA